MGVLLVKPEPCPCPTVPHRNLKFRIGISHEADFEGLQGCVEMSAHKFVDDPNSIEKFLRQLLVPNWAWPYLTQIDSLWFIHPTRTSPSSFPEGKPMCIRLSFKATLRRFVLNESLDSR